MMQFSEETKVCLCQIFPKHSADLSSPGAHLQDHRHYERSSPLWLPTLDSLLGYERMSRALEFKLILAGYTRSEPKPALIRYRPSRMKWNILSLTPSQLDFTICQLIPPITSLYNTVIQHHRHDQHRCQNGCFPDTIRWKGCESLRRRGQREQNVHARHFQGVMPTNCGRLKLDAIEVMLRHRILYNNVAK